MTDHLGQILGNYRLIQRLGRGGFAEVYLGEHLHLKTQAAIKVLAGHLTPPDRENFLKEAQTIAALQHPHIVHILDFGFDAGTPFLVMQYAAQGTLRDRHPRGTILPLSTIISYVKPIAAALDSAHQVRIIHRDIKPENVLIDDDKTVLLSDFGIATIAHSTATMHTIESIGTPHYMAPEQFQGKPCPASDQYSLAIVVYEWLCGQRPFTANSFFAIGAQHVAAPVPSLRRMNKAIPLHVEQTLLRALAKPPKQRFGSVEDFGLALEQACLAQPQDTMQQCIWPTSPLKESAINSPQLQQPYQPSNTLHSSQEKQSEQMPLCLRCNAALVEGDTYCGSCGKYIMPRQRILFRRNRVRRMQMQTGHCCPRCHGHIAANTLFCGMCGISLNNPMRSPA